MGKSFLFRLELLTVAKSDETDSITATPDAATLKKKIKSAENKL